MKAPGKWFRKGISLAELMEMFPDEASAEAWFEETRWGAAGRPDRCPICDADGRLGAVPSGKPLPYWCGSCRRNFSVRTGSVMHRSHVPLRKWVIAIHLWATSLKGVSSMKLHRDLGITQKSACFLAQRLREAWSNMPSGMKGPVEADETWMGGKRKNTGNARRRGMTGRGAVGKTPVAALKDRDTGRVAARVLGAANAEELRGFVRDHAEPGAALYTGGALAYAGLPEYSREAVNHSISEFVRGMAHSNGVESFRAMLKRAHCGTFHHISEKHLHRYVLEFAARHNMRPRDTAAIMADLAARMAGKRPACRELIAD